MSIVPMQKSGNGVHPVSRFLHIQKSKSSAKNYAAALKQFFGFIDGEVIRRTRGTRTPNDEEALAALDAKAVAYLAEVRDDERSAGDDLIDFIAGMEKEGFAPSTIFGARAGVNGFFELNGIELSRLQEKAIKRTLPKHMVVAEEADITMEMLRKILPLMNNQVRSVSLIMLACGCRAGEALKLRLKDVDLDTTPARVSFKLGSTKNGKRRISYLTPEAVDEVKAWLAIRDEYIISAAKRMGALVKNGYAPAKQMADDRLFPFDPSTFYMGWNTAVQKAGLYEACEETGRAMIHPHGLRKYFRTYLGAAAGVDVAEKLMGHEGYLSGAYVRLTEADLAVAYEKHSHVLTVARGASGELLRQVADQREAVAELTADNATLRGELAAVNARLAKIDAQNEAERKAFLNSPLMRAMGQMKIKPGKSISDVKFEISEKE
ncbi:MAG: site-specific integrase [Methanospirillum sp.]